MPLADGMMDILVRIMAEVLSVLALATKQIKQGRFSKLIPLNFFAFVSRPFREVRRGVAEAWRRYQGRPPQVGPPHPRSGSADRNADPGAWLRPGETLHV